MDYDGYQWIIHGFPWIIHWYYDTNDSMVQWSIKRISMIQGFPMPAAWNARLWGNILEQRQVATRHNTYTLQRTETSHNENASWELDDCLCRNDHALVWHRGRWCPHLLTIVAKKKNTRMTLVGTSTLADAKTTLRRGPPTPLTIRKKHLFIISLGVLGWFGFLSECKGLSLHKRFSSLY